MARRILATTLWGYFGWYFAGHTLAVLEVAPDAAILGGVAMAAVAQLDVRRLLGRTASPGPTSLPTASAGR